jgi:DNA-binding PadR family transcriptional regulator
MADKNLRLGEFEEKVLLAVMGLGTNAYGVTIREAVQTLTEQSVSIGALYTTLSRLEAKGMVSSRLGESTAQRGGRAKRYYKIEGTGQLALTGAERARTRLREGLSPNLQPAGSKL